VIAAIIPARWASTRFPGKPLHPIAGKPLVQHVWERCLRAKRVERVIIATDDMRIAEAAFDFGAEVSLTHSDHPTGTDRVAEVARRLRDASHVINVQGDEPLVEPGLIDRLARVLTTRKAIEMVTAASPLVDPSDIANPNNVKVVTTRDGRALYFSRSPVPHVRADGQTPPFLWHMGIYGYRRDFLLRFVRWKPTPLENAEKLEQLRALENGASIHVVVTPERSHGVDTPEDAAVVEGVIGRMKLASRRSVF
jgi:3-deoxy-manno-octulosonate cytidylyltransferase (CMP-KDO synthetase)